MYKVKIFDEEHELDLEEAINYFLESEDINKLIDSLSINENRKLVVVIFILFNFLSSNKTCSK